jgi:hypothetical protein
MLVSAAMRILPLIAATAVFLTAAAAAPQKRDRPVTGYKPVAIALPQPVADNSFDAMRKQVGEAAQHKDRAAMAGLVVARGFFWQRDNRIVADKRKSGFDVLAAALGLNNKDSAGWEILASTTDDPTASPAPGRAGALCAPAEPAYDRKAFADLLAATSSDITEWGYPVSTEIAAHAAPQSSAPAIEKLGLYFVRMMPESASTPPSWLRIAIPSGQIGYVSVDSIAPIGNDQICYVKDNGAWKIGGYVGSGEPQ